MDIVTPFPFSFVVTLGWLGFFLLVGVFLRAKITFFRKYLIPSCIIGGFIGMIFNMLGFFGTGLLSVDKGMIEIIAFHFFGLYFAATSLNSGENPCKPVETKPKKSSKRFTFGAMWLASVQYSIQQVMIIACVLVMLGLNLFMGTDYIGSTAQLLPSGFSSGPGPAMTTGKIWDEFLQDGRGLAGLGLTTGSLGFLFAYIIGIPLANYYHRKRKLQISIDQQTNLSEQQGYYEYECGPSLGHETTHTSNVDSLAFQFGIIFFIYLLAIMVGYVVVKALGNSPAVGMVWGLFFMIPLVTGLFVKKLLKKIGYFHLVNQRINNRIMNAFIDFIVLASFFGIVLTNIQQYLYFLVFGIAAIIVILLVLIPLMTKYVNNFREERVLYLTGLLTGTAATGLFLVRIIDPEGKAPLPIEVALGNIFILLFAIPLTPIGYMEVMFGRTVWEYLALISVSVIVYMILAVISTKLLNRAVVTDAPELIEK